MARKKKEPDNLVEICGKTYVILDTDVSDGRVNHKAISLEDTPLTVLLVSRLIRMAL